MTPEERSLNSDGTPVEWWFNSKTGEVEFGRLSAKPYRIGPFKTAEEARDALKKIAERAELWKKDEEQEN